MNIINAIINLVTLNNPVTTITATYQNKNRANSAEDAFEEYVKDLFAGSFDLEEKKRVQRLSEVFSYFGNSTNPPDGMLRGGDAIEVKKIETKSASLALNSSYPKHTLKSTSTLINNACRTAEDWTEKDMIYVVGVLKNNKLLRMSWCTVWITVRQKKRMCRFVTEYQKQQWLHRMLSSKKQMN